MALKKGDKIRVSVTQENIDHGFSDDPRECPIALAMQNGGFKKYRVRSFYVCHDNPAKDDGLLYHSRLPEEAVDFIDIFDEYKEGDITPFEFDIEVDYILGDEALREFGGAL